MSGTAITEEERLAKWNTYDDDGFRKQRLLTLAWIQFRERLRGLVNMGVYNIDMSVTERVPIEYALYEHCFLLEDEWEEFLEEKVRKYLQDSYNINVRISDEYLHLHSNIYHKHKECYVELIPKNGFIPSLYKLL